jgi:hypothetical protein
LSMRGVKSAARFGCAVSLFDNLSLGSSFSIRSYTIAGSHLSCFGRKLNIADNGKTKRTSVADRIEVASSISIRSRIFTRSFGNGVTMLNYSTMGSSLSVRN